MEYIRNPNNIRNICIVAHVDHGKTTIADSLIASNGIISHRMAGQLRYMDCLEEEQERGITMKSSSIALKYSSNNEQKYLINLLDTPGHVDFGAEVSAAVRLCDGALVVIDVVEGVCPQTIAALEQAWREGIEPILVLNKIDRLIVEEKLDETGAYLRLKNILEQVNALVATFLTRDLFENEESTAQDFETTDEANLHDWAGDIAEFDDEQYYFMPEKNNVIFASAIDNWAFTIDTFAKFMSDKHMINLSALKKTLWGDYYVDTKQKRIFKGAFSKAKVPLFVSMVLKNIWRMYDIVVIRRDKIKMQDTCKVLDIEMNNRELNHTDARYQIKLIMSKWLPLPKHVLGNIVQQVPSPKNLSVKRIDKLLLSELANESLLEPLKDSFSKCSSELDALKIAFISKMITRDKKDFVALARVFSGTISKGDKLFVLGPRYDPREYTNEPPPVASVENLFIMMGRDMEPVDSIGAGNVVGILGLKDHLVKTGTLSSTPLCLPFHDSFLSTAPILRVAIEPKDIQDMPKLIEGLKLLNQADPSVEVRLQQTGEHVIVATGELHLQHCIRDLQEIYAEGFEINVSQPIVPFRETLVLPPKIDMVKEAINDNNTDLLKSKTHQTKKPIEIMTPNRKCVIKLQAFPLPEGVADIVMRNESLKSIQKLVMARNIDHNHLQIDENLVKILTKFKCDLQESFNKAIETNSDWKNIYSKDIVDRIWSFGPRYNGPNLLVASPNLQIHYSIFEQLLLGVPSNEHTSESPENLSQFINSFISGFQLATQAGPLCEEPMQNVCFTIHEWRYLDDPTLVSGDQTKETHGPFSGQMISTVKDVCRKAFQDQPQRLMNPMFSCDITVTSDVLGKMYAVIGRRHGRILDSIPEGAQGFRVKALIPVIESIDFVGEIRKQTSGLANPQLIFSHYEIINVDPFWSPSTEEEYALFGEKADTENLAKRYMSLVRKRKGLPTLEKLVEHGEKQRTFKRNK